jgi:nucleoside-diphosphate-sugar epimerase
MKILVTGAAGYVGSVLCHKLISEGHEVIGIDNMMYGGKSLLGLINNPNFRLIIDDISNTGSYKKFIDSNTVVVNLAAIVGEPAANKFPLLTKATNIEATKKIIDLAASRNAKKFIFISTCSNYGKVALNALANEDSELNPLSLYAETKVEMELYLKKKVDDNLNWTILRFATIYGLSPRPRFDLTVNDFTLHAIIDKKLLIYLPKTNRPYLHVIDAARAIQLIVNKIKETANNVYNVGATEENYRKIDIVEQIKSIIGDFKVEFIERGTDLRDYRVSFEKIKSELGFFITKRVRNGIEEIYRAIEKKLIKDFSNPEYYNV